MGQSPVLQIVAGEPSGDTHAAAVLRELSARLPGLRAFGFGGKRLAEAGMRLDEDLASHAIMGIFPVLKSLPYIKKLFDRAVRGLREERPDALLLVDYPGFNMRLAARARDLGVPVIYYISPQVWAWAPGRIRKLARLVDLMLVILPFEAEVYRKTGMETVFTGHPVFDHVGASPADGALIDDLRSRRGAGPLIGVFPGSRKHVVASLAPQFAAVARRLRAEPKTADSRFVFALAQPRFRPIVERHWPANVPHEFVDGHSLDVMRAADLCLTTSGTTTLEIAAVGTPFVLAYHTSPLFYFVARKLVTIDHIGLVNLVAGRTVVPEHVGWRALDAGIAADLTALWTDQTVRDTQLAGLADVRRRLDVRGAYARAAAEIAKKLATVIDR